jgi:phosphohistidine phosphatase
VTDGHPSPDRQLIVLRHAKSDWPAGIPDKDRPLAKRGRRDAPAAGRWLAEHVGRIDLVVHSDARRTTETWAAVEAELIAGGGRIGKVKASARVYDASAEALLEVLRAVPDDVGRVLLVGHNPGVQDLVVTLAGQGSESGAALAAAKFPTSGLALLRLAGPWSGMAAGGAILEEFVVPRG